MARGVTAPVRRALLMLCVCAGCASLPKGEYGVRRIDWKGVEQMSSEALAACLATKERESFQLRLGLGSAQCGSPPFDEHVPRLSLFSWPWTEWRVYDPAIFEVDRKRIIRWYQARGFYEVQLGKIRYSAGGKEVDPAEHCTSGPCKLTIHIPLEEGVPIRVVAVELAADARLAPDLMKILRKSVSLHADDRFDENNYESDKARLLDLLKENSYAKAQVDGRLEIDRDQRTARVHYALHPGPACRFGSMRVEGNGKLNSVVIKLVADIRRGTPYKQSTIVDAERAVYTLAAFSAVRIDTETKDGSSEVDLVVRVRPARLESWRFGIGVMSGTLQSVTSDETVSVPEWDVHLRAVYRNQNFLGGMRKLRVEERPRMIMLREFPFVPDSGPRPGNTLIASFEQPRFLEARTVFFIDGQWDLGPDAFYGYFRHDLATKVGLRRPFFRHAVKVELALEHDLYEIISSSHPDTVSSYRLPFAAQEVRLDLRDNPQRPHRGLYVANIVQEAVRLGYGSWNYIRWLPEVRVYELLPWKLVLAQRLAFGALFIRDADDTLDPTSQRIGPQTYRLRGGGANSNRGFAPGTLGDGITGGKRRWEGSLELRVPLNADLGLALFFDAGDVSGTALRLNHLNASTGFGLRYITSFAPIRLDLGWRIPGWQVIGAAEGHVPLHVLPSAAHLTIGEAF